MASSNFMHRAAALLTLFVALVAFAPAQAAMKIQEVRSKGGITAWLVEDYTIPMISMRMAFRGGSTQDPDGKEGLANLITGLLDEGAGDIDSDAFQEKLDEIGMDMRFSEGSDAIYGSVRTLSSAKDDAFALLALALKSPRFDQAPIDRIRGQIVSGIIAGEKNPETIAGIAWSEALYGKHPYARRDQGTQATLAGITAEDLHTFHRRNFARDNLTVGVVGAIDAETLARVLDQVFGGLPEKANLVPVADVEAKLAQEIRIDYDLPQSSIQLAYPGLKRDDPEFFAAFLMNHIFGGGTFSSRLFSEVREKRGLAYSVGSSLVNNRYSSSLIISTATRADRAAETLKIIRDEAKKMADEGPTEAELVEAKKYIVGAYAINNLDSSGSIANTLVDLQMEELGMDYIDRRAGLINAVTVEQAKAAAQRLLTTEPAVLILGPAASK
ncbi:MAG: M16 family metallopeptidase [Rhizobiaceae bacterium]